MKIEETGVLEISSSVICGTWIRRNENRDNINGESEKGTSSCWKKKMLQMKRH